MPQPLNRVVPNASFQHNPNVLNDKPKLSKYVASIFAQWGLIEYRLSLLLVRILGADAEPALAMFSTLTAQHLQLGALEAAAKAALSSTEFDIFQAGMDITDRVQTPRNHLAHWIWGDCPELPDALCVADPKMAKERDREFTLALERFDKDGINVEEFYRLNNPDTASVLVYREGDLERANRDLEQAGAVTFLTVIYLDGLFRGRRKPGSPDQLKLTRGHIFQQLSGIQLFREAWDQIQKDRKKSPQSPLGSPPREPNG
jgi:hypothetical protein